MSARNIVKYKLDAERARLPEQRARLKRVAAIPDSAIDYSDISPASPDAVWTRPGALVPEGRKQLVTLRLDPDVLAFFKATGARYQTRINAALREYIKRAA